MSPIVFESDYKQTMVLGNARYVMEDHAFDFQVTDDETRQWLRSQSTTSFVIGTLQLEISVTTASCLYIWGFCPMTSWVQASLFAPAPQPVSLYAAQVSALVPGVSIGLESMILPEPRFDPLSGWFCMGNPKINVDDRAIEFASSCVGVATLERRLSSLWVRPSNWETVARRFRELRMNIPHS